MASTHQVQCRGDYPADYQALASALGSKRLQSSEKEQRFIAGMATGEHHSVGSVNVTDIEFLSAIAAASGATRAVEIGTASGVSAAVITAALARGFEERGETLPGVLLDTIDRKERCLFDASKPIGFMVHEIAPDLASRVRFHTNSDSTKAKHFIGRRELNFAFIDANHQHPWPLIDALAVLPLMRPGAWMVLHDIDNPAERPAGEVRLGARYVFQAWPTDKIDGGYIGAVQVPKDPRVMRGLVEEVLQQPFEVEESGWLNCQKRIRKLTRAASRRSLGWYLGR